MTQNEPTMRVGDAVVIDRATATTNGHTIDKGQRAIVTGFDRTRGLVEVRYERHGVEYRAMVTGMLHQVGS